ncbi:hypothetical protein L210DRAFT_3631378 [Boletus edulis BED1]|uniref:Uncharacterized protein n=1 Tax=Boletus edulis BED1 TaxID=1328754 RepID=A0AAD4BS13_BOLED|nr:hypothetical protein L210DRAFT_3631378 [Boletus edulis BED1]
MIASLVPKTVRRVRNLDPAASEEMDLRFMSLYSPAEVQVVVLQSIWHRWFKYACLERAPMCDQVFSRHVFSNSYIEHKGRGSSTAGLRVHESSWDQFECAALHLDKRAESEEVFRLLADETGVEVHPVVGAAVPS